MQQVQLTDSAYEQAKKHAVREGVASVNQFIEDILLNGLADETDDYDHLFTPQVIASLE